MTDKQRGDAAEKRVEEAAKKLGEPNKTGDMSPVSGVGGRGKKSLITIAAAETGFTKEALKKRIARSKKEEERKNEVLARVPPELREKFFSLATRKDSSPGSAADYERAEKALAVNPNATYADVHLQRTKQPNPDQAIDRDRLITKIYNTVLGTRNYDKIRKGVLQNTWPLSDTDLFHLSELPPRWLKKMLPCLLQPDLEPLVGFPND